MLGAIHRAVLGEGPPQLREFFRLDNSLLRRSDRHIHYDRQLECSFGSRPLDMIKRSVLGLCQVHNLLQARIMRCQNVGSFQRELQQLLCAQAVAALPRWQELYSPRWPVQLHPLRTVR